MNNNNEPSIESDKKEPVGNKAYEPIGIPSVDKSQEVHDRLIRMGIDAAKNKELEEQKDPRKSQRDPLTGLYNRECFERFKKYEFDPDNDDNKVILLFFDINDLKLSNDTKGHEVGDKMILDTTDVLLSVFDENSDYIMRIGGDEFLVVCRDDSEDEGFEQNKLDQVRKSLLERPSLSIAYGSKKYHKDIKFTTKSNELVEFQDTDLKYVLKQADINMLEMKQKQKFDKLNRFQKLFRKVFKKSFAKIDEIR